MPPSTSGPSRWRSTTRWPASESRMRWRSASVSASLEPWRRNLMFAQASLASWRRDTIPFLYAARPKWRAEEPSMGVLSRSKNAAPFTALRLDVGVEPAQERRIREAYAAFVRGDLDSALASFVPEATFTNPAYAVEGGVRVGYDEIRAGFKSLHDEFEYSSLDVEQLIEGPEGVLVVVRFQGSGKTSGAPLDVRFFHVFRMRGEEVLDFAWFTSLEEGRRAVGL